MQVIVYAGAIMVLFVFVIMLLNAGEEERTGRQPCCAAVRRTRVLVGERAGGVGPARTHPATRRCIDFGALPG